MLIDVFAADPTFGPRSRDALRQSLTEGSTIACDVVWSEVTAAFASGARAAEELNRIGVSFSPLEEAAALRAGDAWRAYRRGGRRRRMISDFLIGAHALAQAERLLTRDRGFYRACFGGLNLLDPAA